MHADLDARIVECVSAHARGVAAVYLFGSMARGDDTGSSDIDIGILFTTAPPRTLDGQPYALGGELERALGRDVDVVVLNDAPVDLRSRVLRDGRLVVDADRSARIAFEVRTRNEAFDLEPILRRYRSTARGPMTDPALLAKKLAASETCVADLQRLARPSELRRDIKEERFVEHTLQIAIQAALDVASHIVSDERLGEPRTNRELFDLLERAGWLAAPLAETLRRMIGFRNVLVHGYDDVDLAVVQDVVEHRLDDLLQFVAAIRSRLPRTTA
jgi:uncharacterized protein YutE (UPF0331/DUF86 family)/predicted nucleotidyltransferase